MPFSSCDVKKCLRYLLKCFVSVRYNMGMLTFIDWLRQFARFLQCGIAVTLFLYTVLLKWVSLALTQGGKWASPTSQRRKEYLHILFGILPWGRMVSSLLYLYPIQLKIYYEFIFILSFGLYVNIFFAQIISVLAIGSSFMLALTSLWHATFPCFWAFSYSLALQDAPGSFCTFPVAVLESVISPRSMVFCLFCFVSFFNCRMIFRNQDLGTEYAHFFWGSVLLSALSR